MPSFTNMQDLNDYLVKQLRASMPQVGEMVKEKVSSHLDTDVYSFENSDVYTRTHELQSSLEAKNESVPMGAMTTIDHDHTKIIPNEPNQHYSVVDGYSPRESNEFVDKIVEYGLSGHIFGEGYWTEPRPYMENAEKEIIDGNLHVEALAKALGSKGIKTEVL